MITLSKEDIEEISRNNGSTLHNVDTSTQMCSTVLHDDVKNKFHFASAFIMTHKKDEKTNSAIIYCIGENQFVFDCGDAFLSGRLIDHAKIVDLVIEGFPLDNQTMITNELLNNFGLLQRDSNCVNSRYKVNFENFYKNGMAESSGTICCDHINNMFANMPPEIFDQLEKERNKWNRKMRVSSGNIIIDTVKDYGFQGEAIMIVGPGGDGKTYTPRYIAKKNNYDLFELPAHSGTESIEMFGYEMKTGNSFIWRDGKVSQAARNAMKGNKTILFMDEFTNLSISESAGLKSSFEPHEGFYYFETGRVINVEDGIGTIETLKVPVENLQIMCAANMGDGYACEEIDKALKQRFIILYYEASRQTIKSVLSEMCLVKGFSQEVVDKLMSFQLEMIEAMEQGDLPEAPRLRHLSRKILGLAKTADTIDEVAIMQVNQFVDMSTMGKPVEEQVNIVMELIEKHLSEDSLIENIAA